MNNNNSSIETAVTASRGTSGTCARLEKNCRIATRVLRILLITAAAFCLVAVIVSLVSGNASNLAASQSFTLFDADSGMPIDATVANLICQTIYVLCVVVPLAFIIELCARCMATVQTNHTPFVPENVRRIQIIALLTVVCSIVPELVMAVCSAAATQSYNISFNINELCVAFIIWCVSLIFEYGVTLQQRDDETL